MAIPLLVFLFSVPIFMCIYLLYLRRHPYYVLYEGKEYQVEHKNYWLHILLGIFLTLEVLAFMGFNFQLNLQSEIILLLLAFLAVLIGRLLTR